MSTQTADDIGVRVREMETDELIDEYHELNERLGWVIDEIGFRFNSERGVENSDQLNELAKVLNDHRGD